MQELKLTKHIDYIHQGEGDKENSLTLSDLKDFDTISYKIDGAPSIFIGYDKEKNSIFISTKSIGNKISKIAYTEEDCDLLFKPSLADKMKKVLNEASIIYWALFYDKDIRKQGSFDDHYKASSYFVPHAEFPVFRGDLLSVEHSKDHIYRMNIINYKLKYDTDINIAFHTWYDKDGNERPILTKEKVLKNKNITLYIVPSIKIKDLEEYNLNSYRRNLRTKIIKTLKPRYISHMDIDYDDINNAGSIVAYKYKLNGEGLVLRKMKEYKYCKDRDNYLNLTPGTELICKTTDPMFTALNRYDSVKRGFDNRRNSL